MTIYNRNALNNKLRALKEKGINDNQLPQFEMSDEEKEHYDNVIVETKQNSFHRKATAQDTDESGLQIQCVAWLRDKYPDVVTYFCEMPDEGYKINRNKLMGYPNGNPDLLILQANAQYHGLLIEFKTPKVNKKGITTGKLSDNQIIIGENLRTKGYRVEVIWRFDDFINLINDYYQTAIC